MNKCQGTIIRRIPLTETSLIVTWCTERHGIIRAVAKGARRPKSAFAGKLDLFFETEFEIARSRKSDLHVLRDLVVHSPRLGLRASYAQTLAASYFVQLLDLVAEPETPIAPLHSLLARGLDYLSDHPPNRRAVLHFETQLAAELGVLDPDCPAAQTLAGIYHRLPKVREELLQRVGG